MALLSEAYCASDAGVIPTMTLPRSEHAIVAGMLRHFLAHRL